MIITRDILVTHNTCAESLEEFVNVLGGGDPNFSIDFDAAITYIKNLPLPTDEKASWVMFVKNLKNSADFYLMQGVGQMLEKYHLFNQKTGQHEPFETLEAALARKEELFQAHMAEMRALYPVSQEVYVPEEDKSLWKVVG